jgi:hypothetical protein
MVDDDIDVGVLVSRLARQVKDSYPRWICIPGGGYYETNNGSEWCLDCGYYMMRHLRRKDRSRSKDYLLDGGWRTESDTHSFCAHCNCWLRISLTDYGVDEELRHYRENGVLLNPVSDEAYSLDILLSAVSGTAQEEEVEALARALVAREDARVILGLDCPTCDGTGKEARHQLCRDCDEAPTTGTCGSDSHG